MTTNTYTHEFIYFFGDWQIFDTPLFLVQPKLNQSITPYQALPLVPANLFFYLHNHSHSSCQVAPAFCAQFKLQLYIESIHMYLQWLNKTTIIHNLTTTICTHVALWLTLLYTFVWNTCKHFLYVFIITNFSLNHWLNHSPVVDDFLPLPSPIFLCNNKVHRNTCTANNRKT